jgi:hypothetical protein
MVSSFPGNVFYYVTGAGDDVSTRGNGEPFSIRVEGTDPSDPTPTEFDFMDFVYVAGGAIIWANAVLGDWITLEMRIPATPAPTANVEGLGNCNKVPIGGGANLLIPAAGNGGFDLDLATAIPVPAANEETGTQTGFWDWSSPDVGKGVVSPGQAGLAAWNLLDVSPAPIRFMNRFHMLGAGRVDVDPPIKPKKILPHWLFRVTVHSAGRATGTLDVVWSLKTGRVRTA